MSLFVSEFPRTMRGEIPGRARQGKMQPFKGTLTDAQIKEVVACFRSFSK